MDYSPSAPRFAKFSSALDGRAVGRIAAPKPDVPRASCTRRECRSDRKLCQIARSLPPFLAAKFAGRRRLLSTLCFTGGRLRKYEHRLQVVIGEVANPKGMIDDSFLAFTYPVRKAWMNNASS